MQVGKLDAARTQLETAVWLYFSEADPVSIHTLTAAAYQILADISKARGGRPVLKDRVAQWVKRDKQKEARRLLNAAENFFKHANHDPDATLSFTPTQTEVFLFDACFRYRELTGETVPALAVYQAWFWLGPGAPLAHLPEAASLQKYRVVYSDATRQTFFARALPLVTTLK